MRILLGLTISVVAVLLIIIYAISSLHSRRQELIDEEIAEFSADQSASHLTKIRWYQYFGNTYVDLSGSRFYNINLRDLDLQNLRLVSTKMDHVDMANTNGSSLTNVPFSESLIRDFNFRNANLSFSQFQRAQFEGADFSDADLRNTSFDNALFCNVSFEGAYLRQAAFWNSTFDRRTAASLAQSAWWLAVGWNSIKSGN